MTFLQKKTMTPCQSRAIIFPSTLANPFCIKLANKLCANMTVYWFGGIERIKTGSQYWEKRIAWGAAKSNGIRFAIWPPCTWLESRSGPAWISSSNRAARGYQSALVYAQFHWERRSAALGDFSMEVLALAWAWENPNLGQTFPGVAASWLIRQIGTLGCSMTI